MNILFVATELAPYARVGELADAVASLAKTLKQQGHEVTVVCPAFRRFEQAGLQAARRLTPLEFELGGESFEATLFDARLPSGVDLTLVDVGGLFDRDGIYGEDGKDYEDNPYRFAVFSRAVTAWISHLSRNDKGFDVVHLHDWPSALVAAYAHLEPYRSDLDQTRFVLTIHNIAYQGIVDGAERERFGIPGEWFHPDGLEFYGKINMLKGGIVHADAVTTVSETYAHEILSEELGAGLHGVLRTHLGKLSGILHGVDYARCNPATDPALVSRYDALDPSQRLRSKTALLKELGLYMAPGRPVLAFVAPVRRDKGAGLLAEALDELMLRDVAVVVVGSGDESLEEKFSEAAEKWKERMVFVARPPKGLERRVLAGADIFVAPSQNEPCGCLVRCAMRYGAVPVVRAVGGLNDSVVDADSKLQTGSGFTFLDFSPEALLGALYRALAAYHTPEWNHLQKRIMALDVGWDRPARRYEWLYRSLIAPAAPLE